MRVIVLVVVVVVVTGGKQSQLLVLSLSLKFDKSVQLGLLVCLEVLEKF